MLVGGAPDSEGATAAAARVVQMGIDMIRLTSTKVLAGGHVVKIRVGIHSGPAVAAVVGRKAPKVRQGRCGRRRGCEAAWGPMLRFPPAHPLLFTLQGAPPAPGLFFTPPPPLCTALLLLRRASRARNTFLLISYQPPLNPAGRVRIHCDRVSRFIFYPNPLNPPPSARYSRCARHPPLRLPGRPVQYTLFGGEPPRGS
jgi:hypothetical protein